MIDRWVTKTHTIQNFVAGWTSDETKIKSLFNNMLRSWNEKYHVPLITWMPYAYRNWTAPNPNDIISSGGYDDYINNFAKKLKVFLSGPDGFFGNGDDRRAYVRFAHQMNGNWFPWSPSCSWSCEQTGQSIRQTSDSFVNMWQHVVNVLENVGIHNATRLQMVWSVNNINFQDPLTKFYPGDTYVDWIGVDGYNFGDTLPSHGWEPAATVFKDVFYNGRKVSSQKPLAVTEFGTVTSPKETTDKVKWIDDSFKIFNDQKVGMILCYNVDAGKTDFAVFDGANGDETYSDTYNGYSSYRKAIQGDWNMIGTNSTNARLISDDVFMRGIEKNGTNIYIN